MCRQTDVYSSAGTVRAAAVVGRGVTSRERPGGRGDGGEERRGEKKGCWRERGDDCMKRRKKKEKTTIMTPVIHPTVLFYRS